MVCPRVRLTLRTSFLAATALAQSTAPATAQSVSFQADVLPILSDRCFQCHGPDANARKADLRLDLASVALREADPVIVPGKSTASELVARITARDPKRRMPPPGSHLSLTAEQIATLTRWIDEGATWGRHWAFVAPELPALPGVKNAAWPRNGIDRFVLARMEERGLRPARSASRAALLRRVTLDLTGLPPTPGELRAFLADEGGGAYERVVDRLLASPRYGERMAWEWLDAARYADTDGFQNDPTRSMWPWRDWLIDALNENVPLDRLTTLLLAGDLLENATPEQVLASGFHRNHMYNGEGGRIPEETRIENVFDRTETTATVWLGLTMQCARCHDHKFDPISQKEYYRLFDFFNQTSESGRGGSGRAPPVLRYHPPETRRRIAELLREANELDAAMRAPDPELDRAQAGWEARTAERLARAGDQLAPVQRSDWHVLGTLPAPGGRGGKSFGHGFGPERGVDLAKRYGALRWRTAKLPDGKVHALPRTVGATYLYRTLEAPTARTIELSLGSDDAIRCWLNGEQVLAKNVRRAAAADQERVSVQLRKGRNELLLKIVNTGGLAGFYFEVTGESVLGLPAPVVRAVAAPSGERSVAQRRLLLEHYRGSRSAQWKKSAKRLAALRAERSRLQKSAAPVMVMDSLPAAKRRKTRVLERGGYERPLAPVTAGTPAFLPPLPDGAPHNRLTLARWLVSPRHPLTARVWVNRYWQTFFGKGLVATSGDFGVQGAKPSHPLLLDWLARRFAGGGWDVKALHRLIVTSATYRQTARVGRAAYRADPDNRWLARGARFRLPSWMLRDQALFASGLLDETFGGPPVKPYQPSGVWAEATFGKIRYRPDTGAALYRRSVYVFWRRIVGPTAFFDCSKRQTCQVEPVRTNTPLHALTTLNDTTFVEAARVLAARCMTAVSDTVEARVAHAFLLAAGRRPGGRELAVLVRRWGRARADFAARPDDVAKLLGVGQAAVDARLDKTELAAYAVVCSLILNLDEVLTRS